MAKKKNIEIEPFPWEQQAGETAKKYEAFQCYLHMKTDEEDRSLRKVAFDLNKSLTYIGTLSSQYNWVERAEAYDREQLRLTQKKFEAEMARMREIHAKAGRAMVMKASKRIAQIDVSELTPQDVKNWMETGTKIERLSRGDTSEVIENRDGGTAINPVSIYLPDNGRDDNQDDDANE